MGRMQLNTELLTRGSLLCMGQWGIRAESWALVSGR